MLSRPVGPVLLGALTHEEWWNRRRSSLEGVVSELVHLECAEGDPAAAAAYTRRTDGRRLECRCQLMTSKPVGGSDRRRGPGGARTNRSSGRWGSPPPM